MLLRILIDEQLPRQLAPYLVGHDARTVQQESWAGLKNGALLTKAEDAGFSVFLTGDQNLEFQQNISKMSSWRGHTLRYEQCARRPSASCSRWLDRDRNGPIRAVDSC